MMLCNSDNVIRCFDVYENKSLKIMIIEFCNGGTLQSEIDVKKRIPEKEAILILKQIINGIAVFFDITTGNASAPYHTQGSQGGEHSLP